MDQTSFVGVDTHKDTLACYVNQKFKEFPTTLKGFQQAVKWSKSKIWAIEGAYCFGMPFTAYLIKNGHEVYEVNPLLTKSWRQVIAINGKKNDYGDAKVISLFAHTQPLQKVSLLTVRVKQLLTTRNLFVKQRTKTINSLRMYYASIGKEIAINDFTTNKAVNWLLKQDDIIIQSCAEVLLTFNAKIKLLEAEIEKSIPEEARALLILKGIKTLTAAAIYANTKGKQFTQASLASYCGVAPVEQGSGKKTRYRNNKGGNRELNAIFYRLSIIQSIYDEKGKEYYEKKLKEGKTPRHARKCLARQLVKQVWKILNQHSQVKTGTLNIPVLTGS